MGQKVHPKGFRLGIYEAWHSLWFARDSYGKQVLEDQMIRSYLDRTLKGAEVSSVHIEKAGENVRVQIFSARPGVVIGKKGSDIESLRRRVANMLPGRVVEVSVQEVQSPETDAMVMAKSIYWPEITGSNIAGETNLRPSKSARSAVESKPDNSSRANTTKSSSRQAMGSGRSSGMNALAIRPIPRTGLATISRAAT